MSANAAALGIDIGSTTAKCVVVDGEGRRLWEHLEPADPRIDAQARRVVAQAREATGAASGLPLVATGYGRNLVAEASRTVTEITCHARGVFRELGRAGTLVDVGGQDSKVIVLGAKGNVVNFSMNDKCAAGTGRFLENTAARLGVAMDEMGPLAIATTAHRSISSTCTVFAESEVISLIAQGVPVEQIVRGLHLALIQRLSAMVKAAGFIPPVFLSGGVARNPAVRQFLGEALGHVVELPPSPQMMGAYGAALIALG